MKCFNCKNRNANTYQRIGTGHRLYQTFHSMNPNRLIGGNSFACENCLHLAEQHFRGERVQISHQSKLDDVTSLGTTATHSTVEGIHTIGQSSVSKPSNDKENFPRQRPGPASSKTKSSSKQNITDKKTSQGSVPEYSILLNIGSQTSAESSQEVSSASSAGGSLDPHSNLNPAAAPIPVQSSKDVSKETSEKQRVLLERSKSSSGHKIGPASSKRNQSKSSSSDNTTTSSEKSVRNEVLLLSESEPRSEDIANATPPTSTHKSTDKRNSKSVPSKRTSATDKNLQPKRLKFGDAPSRPGPASTKNTKSKTSSQKKGPPTGAANTDEQRESISTASAPAPKNPRLREGSAKLPEIMRRFFEEGARGPAVNINNYSRTLAG